MNINRFIVIIVVVVLVLVSVLCSCNSIFFASFIIVVLASRLTF